MGGLSGGVRGNGGDHEGVLLSRREPRQTHKATCGDHDEGGGPTTSASRAVVVDEGKALKAVPAFTRVIYMRASHASTAPAQSQIT